MALTGHERFGRHLRRLRAERDLTLKEVAALSRTVSTDSSGQFSHAYLSQLETGTKAALALPKFLSLAAIYAVSPEDLLPKVPRDLRSHLQRELTKWREHGHVVPRALRRLPHVVRRVQRAMEEELTLHHEDVSFPLGFEAECLAHSSNAIGWAAIVPFLETQKPEGLTRVFYKTYLDDIDEHLRNAANEYHRSSEWFMIATEFRDWLQYDQQVGPKLVRLVERWSINVTLVHESACPLSCTFSDPATEQRHGFAHVPVGVVEAVRWRQLAKILFDAGLGSQEQDRPRPPEVAEAAIDVLALLLDPTSAQPVLDTSARHDAIIESLNALLCRVPHLRREPSAQSLREIEPVAEFLMRLSPSNAPA